MSRRKVVKVFVQGSFDLMHYGHLKYLKKCKEHGDYLIVGVNTDRLYKKYKNKKPIIPYEYRKEVVRSLEFVDEVIPAPHFSPIKLLKKYDVDIFIIFDEWKDTKAEEIKFMKSKGAKAIVVSFPDKTLSSTDIKRNVLHNYLKGIELCPSCQKKIYKNLAR